MINIWNKVNWLNAMYQELFSYNIVFRQKNKMLRYFNCVTSGTCKSFWGGHKSFHCPFKCFFEVQYRVSQFVKHTLTNYVNSQLYVLNNYTMICVNYAMQVHFQVTSDSKTYHVFSNELSFRTFSKLTKIILLH